MVGKVYILDIIGFILNVISIVVLGIILWKIEVKKEDVGGKIYFFIMAISLGSLLLIFFLDKYNIPTHFLHVNVDTKVWLEILANYARDFCTVGATVIVSVFISLYQIRKNSEDNHKRDKESLRINNIPILKYELSSTYQEENSEEIKTIYDNEKLFNINIMIKNVGLNSVKKISINMESDILFSIQNLIEASKQSIIEKGHYLKISKRIQLKSNKTYIFKLSVHYEDLMNNEYIQEITINYVALENSLNKKNTGIIDYIIGEEKLISSIK